MAKRMCVSPLKQSLKVPAECRVKSSRGEERRGDKHVTQVMARWPLPKSLAAAVALTFHGK